MVVYRFVLSSVDIAAEVGIEPGHQEVAFGSDSIHWGLDHH